MKNGIVVIVLLFVELVGFGVMAENKKRVVNNPEEEEVMMCWSENTSLNSQKENPSAAFVHSATLYLELEDRIIIYNASGSVVADFEVSGKREVRLPMGLYLVKGCRKNVVYKVCVN